MSGTCQDQERLYREAAVDASAEARRQLEEHACGCPNCEEDLRLWDGISQAAPSLRRDWPSPGLWPQVRSSLLQEKALRQRTSSEWQWGLWLPLAACCALILVSGAILLRFYPQAAPTLPSPAEARLLSEEALRQVEESQEAYEQAIDLLAQSLAPQLSGSSEATPVLEQYREKLRLIDEAILECRSMIQENRFNAHLRRHLLSVYREKHSTLEALSRESVDVQ